MENINIEDLEQDGREYIVTRGDGKRYRFEQNEDSMAPEFRVESLDEDDEPDEELLEYISADPYQIKEAVYDVFELNKYRVEIATVGNAKEFVFQAGDHDDANHKALRLIGATLTPLDPEITFTYEKRKEAAPH